MDIDPALFLENERLAPGPRALSFVDIGPFECERGGRLDAVRVAYEAWGEPDPQGANCVLVCHALTGDSHAVGWWDRLVGPGRAIDTDRFFVICTNSLGGCQGTIGPASPSSEGPPYGPMFPDITIGDTVEVMRRALRAIGVNRLFAAAGGSMGGMQVLEWTRRYPGDIEKAWITACCAAHDANQIGFNEAQRQAVMRDPKWRGGAYPRDDPPADGLAVSRMIAHLMFLSEASLEAKFGRRFQEEDAGADRPRFQVESYLNYQGDKFTRRFDAYSFVLLTRAMNAWELGSLKGSTTDYLFTSFSSDRLYPSRQSAELLRMAREAGCRAEWHDIDLPYGHDAFLLDAEHQGELVREFLARN